MRASVFSSFSLFKPFFFQAILALLCIFNFGCDRKKSETATLRIQLDPSVLQQAQNHSGKMVSDLNNESGDWGLPDPASLSEITCYAVFIGGPEAALQTNSCQTFENQDVVFGQWQGFITLGESMELEVLAGVNRNIYLVGVVSADGTCSGDFTFDAEIENALYSNPFIIGETVADLVDGENVVSVPLNESFTDANKIEDCDFFSNLPSTPGTTPIQDPLLLSEGEPYDFQSIGTGSSTSHLFTLTNLSTVDTIENIAASFSSAAYSFTGGSFPGTGGDCGSVLSPGTSCSVSISFSPTTATTYTDTLSVTYEYLQSTQTLTRDFTGDGFAAASLTFSPGASYDYGTVTIGGSVSQTFTVTNVGAGTATGISASPPGTPFDFLGGSYPGSGGDCGSSLVPGGTCTVVVEFSPSSTISVTNPLGFVYDPGDGGSITSSFDLVGVGQSPALLTISETDPYDFGPVSTASNASHIFTITNTGGDSATALFESGLSAPFAFKGGSFPGTAGTCGSTLASGSSCDIEIEFAPTVLGPFSDTIQIDYNDGVSAQMATRDVQGTGI